MSLKHQIKEEETLLAYFRQMLSDPEDESNYEHNEHEESVDTSAAMVDSREEPVAVFEPMLQPKAAPENDFVQQTLTITPSKSLETLLESVDEHRLETVVHDEVKTLQAAPAVTEPAVGTAVQAAEPVTLTLTDTVTILQTQTHVQVKDETLVKTTVETQAVQTDPEVLAQAAIETASEVKTDSAVLSKETTAVSDATVTDTDTKTQNSDRSKYNPDQWKNIETEEEFQTLFFTVQGVRFAVPLIDLGNILECGKITQIFGKPAWYMGMTDSRGEKINIVDTLLWVKPEIGESPDKYPYLISLSNSNWALGCDVLEGNKTLTRSQVKWRVNAGSRPWLAGIVKDQMCALLHVDALISLFKKGMDFGQLKEKFGDIS